MCSRPRTKKEDTEKQCRQIRETRLLIWKDGHVRDSLPIPSGLRTGQSDNLSKLNGLNKVYSAERPDINQRNTTVSTEVHSRARID